MQSMSLSKSGNTGSRPARTRVNSKDSLVKSFKSFRFPDSDISRVIEGFYSSLDTPIALSCWLLYASGEHEQLASKELDPVASYTDAARFSDDFAAISFLRKAPFLKTGINLKETAMKAFFSSEEDCKVTNRRFKNLHLDCLYDETSAVLHEALRRKIRHILRNFDLEKTLDLGSWGPGVTQTCKGKDTSASRKFREERGITSKAYRLFVPAARIAYPGWFTEEFIASLQEQKGNQVITVAKNSKTDRTIGIEPGVNSFFQLGLGRSIRLRLRKAGYDLSSDEKNRQGALTGSLDNSLATVDFSSASDTIASEMVRTILPDDWFFALDSARSPCYNLDGALIPYAKFSAMGNGFTFELESVIFLSAALVVCEHLGLSTDALSVFGDDIIIPSEAMDLYRRFCTFLGFKVNPRKSFSTGPFRESCGSYYFNGTDVKPVFLTETPSDAKSIFRLANSVRILAHRRRSNFGCDIKFRPVWHYLVRRVPSALRAFGPLSAGDASLSVNFDEARPRVAKWGWEGFLHSGFIERSVSIHDEQPSQLLAKLRYRSAGVTQDELNAHLRDPSGRPLVGDSRGNDVPLRSVTRIAYKTAMFATQWYNFGPWC